VTPFLRSRFERHLIEDKKAHDMAPEGFVHELQRFYYDTAQGNHPGALDALRRVIPVSHIVYGTDFPFRPGSEENEGLGSYGFSSSELAAIERGNALGLLPRLKS
jgi:predicted TIM-barrel fold metal-dependent hydrolase